MPFSYQLRSDFILVRVVDVPPKPAGRGTPPVPGRKDYVVEAKGPSVPAALKVGDRVVILRTDPDEYLLPERDKIVVRDTQVVAVVTGGLP